MRSSLKLFALLILVLSFSTANSVYADNKLKGPKGVDYGEMGETYGPITSRDTMWKLGNKFRHRNNVSVYQVMVATLKKNPSAFEYDNLNGLRNGSIIKIPSHKEVSAIEPHYAKERADADDELWSKRLAGKLDPKDVKEKLAPIEAAKQIDVTNAKDEISEEIKKVEEKQLAAFDNIQSQLSNARDANNSLKVENVALQEKLSALSEKLSNVEDALGNESQLRTETQQILSKLEELLLQQQEDLALSKAQAEEKGITDQINEFLSSTLGLIIVTSLISISLLVALGLFLKNKAKPEINPLSDPLMAPPMQSAVKEPILNTTFGQADSLDVADDLDIDDSLDDLDPFSDDLSDIDDSLDADLDALDLDDDLLDDDVHLDDELPNSDESFDDSLDDDLLDDLTNDAIEEIDLAEDDESELVQADDIDALLDADDEIEDSLDGLADGLIEPMDENDIVTESDEVEESVAPDENMDTGVDDIDDELGLDDEDFDIDSLIDEAGMEDTTAIKNIEEEIELDDDEDFDIDSLIEDANLDSDITEPEATVEDIADDTEEDTADDEDFDIDSLIDDANLDTEAAEPELESELTEELEPEVDADAQPELDAVVEDIADDTEEDTAENIADDEDFDIDSLIDDANLDTDTDTDAAEPEPELESELTEEVEVEEPEAEPEPELESELTEEVEAEPEFASDIELFDTDDESKDDLDDELCEDSLHDEIDLSSDEQEADKPVSDVERSTELDEYPELELDEELIADPEDAPVSNEIFEDDEDQQVDSDEVDIDELGDDLAEGVQLDTEAFGADDISNLLSEDEHELVGLTDDDLLNESFDETDIDNLLLDEEFAESSEKSADEDTKSQSSDESFEIDELEQADFDQLLAELSEEPFDSDQDSVENNLEESEAKVESNVQEESDELDEALLSSLEDDFVSVDNLMDELDDGEEVEIPDDLDIDVGLDDFDELTGSRGSVDVDLEEGGFASQLDLAKTYIEMDDIENAKLILDKIALSENAEAKTQAQSMLDALNS